MITKKTTKNVSIKLEHETLKKLVGASGALSELAAAVIVGTDLPLASRSTGR